MNDTEIKQKIYRYLVASCGNAGYPTDHTIRCLLGMIETGEAGWDEVASVAGEDVVRRIVRMRMEVGQ